MKRLGLETLIMLRKNVKQMHQVENTCTNTKIDMEFTFVFLDNLNLLKPSFSAPITRIEPCGYGAYESIPLMGCMSFPISSEQTLKEIADNDFVRNYWCQIYTHGHYGDKNHLWELVGYKVYQNTDSQEELIKMLYVPTHPELFPEESADAKIAESELSEMLV